MKFARTVSILSLLLLSTQLAAGAATPVHGSVSAREQQAVLGAGQAESGSPAAAPAAGAQESTAAPESGATQGQSGRRGAGSQTADLPAGARERMWFAPTAEDWQKPCLIPFQRTWDDALALAKETGKAILICVNMDGEIASEHYAGVRYREPEIARLYEPYVCVIASVYRHTPNDYDAEGHRILCPRFGSVTCGEHIAIEPYLFERFFEGTRVSPRHIMVELDGTIRYDVYFALDTDSVFKLIQDGPSERPSQPQIAVRGDRSVLERVASPDSRDRSAVETAYLAADGPGRRALLQAALDSGDQASADLLRLAVFGLDPELARLARQGLAKSNSPDAVNLIGDALGATLAPTEREALIGALDRLSDRSNEARSLAAVQRGLQTRSQAFDAKAWQQRLAAETGTGRSTAELAYNLAAARDSGDLQGLAANGDRLLEQARAFVDLSEAPETDPTYGGLMRTDAERLLAAIDAAGLESFGSWSLKCYLAASRGDQAAARGFAEAALKAVEGNAGAQVTEAAAPAGDAAGALVAALQALDAAEFARPSTALVLELYAQQQQATIRQARRQGQAWPPSLLADINGVYELLANHPAGTAEQIARHYEFLWTLGAKAQAVAVLDRGVERLPGSPALHQRYRAVHLVQDGPVGLASRYDALIEAHPENAYLVAQAGYADLVIAEHYRRTRPEGWAPAALAAYDHAELRYLALEDPWTKADAKNSPSGAPLAPRSTLKVPLVASEEDAQSLAQEALHFLSMTHAGRARIQFENGDPEAAVASLERAFKLSPRSANLPDGLNLTAVDSAKSLLTRLQTDGPQDLATRLQTALDQLAAIDPTLLELRPFERGNPR